MIINKAIFEAIEKHGDKKHKDVSSRRKQIGVIVGMPKLPTRNWSAFCLALYSPKRVSRLRGRYLNAKQSRDLLVLLDVDHVIPKKEKSVISYCEKNSKEEKHSVSSFRIFGELYDSNFRLIKADRIIKATLLSDYYQGEDNAKLSI